MVESDGQQQSAEREANTLVQAFFAFYKWIMMVIIPCSTKNV